MLDAVVAAGSNPAVMFLKDAIINHRLTVTEMQQAIAGLPLYVRTPTLELLNELFVRNPSCSLITFYRTISYFCFR